MEERLLQHLVDYCSAEMRRVEEALPTGLAKDMGEYHKMCGKHFAYLQMRTYIGDLKQRLINGDEE